VNIPNVAGFRAEYFDNMDLTNLVLVRVDPTVNFNWGTGSPDARIGINTFSARWSGKISPRYSETYTFTVTADDGVRLWVNGQLLINQWVDQAATTYSGTIALSANQSYDVVMEYYENGGNASAQLSWSSASQAQEFIPASRVTVPPPVNGLPVVTLTAPVAGIPVPTNAPVSLTATATDPDGSISRVEFWVDGVKLGQSFLSPYSSVWPGPRTTGTHRVWATAYDNSGGSASSSVASIQALTYAITPTSVQKLTNPDRVSFTFHVTLPAGHAYVIESSSDLVTWTPVQSGTANGTPVDFTDTQTGVTRRFYRVRLTN
jgi:hypothetical protein